MSGTYTVPTLDGSFPFQRPPVAEGGAWPREEGASSGWPLALWVPIDAVLGFVLTLVLTIGAVFVYLIATGTEGSDAMGTITKDPTFFLVSLALQSLAFVLIVLLRIRVARRLPLAWLGMHARRLLPALGWGTAAGFTFLVVNLAFGALFQFLGQEPDQAEQLTGPFKNASALNLALFGVGLAVVAPVVEELFFRGYALRAISQRLGPTWGLFLSAGLFAAPHLLNVTRGFIALLVPLFIGGLILGFVYQRTRNLWSAIVAHAINNGVAFLGLLYTLSNPQ